MPLFLIMLLIANTVYCCSFTVELSIVICSCTDINKNVSSFAGQALLHEALKVQGPWHALRCCCCDQQTCREIFFTDSQSYQWMQSVLRSSSESSSRLLVAGYKSCVGNFSFIPFGREVREVRTPYVRRCVTMLHSMPWRQMLLTQTFVLSRWYWTEPFLLHQVVSFLVT